MGRIVWGRELAGGTLTAMLALPGILACALVVVAPLDRALFPLAVQSALIGALGASFLGCWLTGIRGQLSGPKITLSLLIAAELALNPNLTPATFLMLIGAMTALCGVMQIIMGGLRLGSVVRYLPYPVLAGFLMAVSIAALWSQLPLVLAGLLPGFAARDDLPQPVSVLAIAVTVAVALGSGRLLPRVPSSIAGLVAGIAGFYLLGHLLTPSFAYINKSLGQFSLSGSAFSFYSMHDLPLTRQLLPQALALAILASLDSLMSAAAIHKLTGHPLKANRELMGQGFTNIVVGLAGGLPISGSQLRAEQSIRIGAKTEAASIFDGLIVLTVALLGVTVLAQIPTAAIVGILIAAVLGSLKSWGIDPVLRIARSLLRGGKRRVLFGDLATLGGVLAVGLLFGPSAGVAVGVLAAMVLFIVKSGSSVVHTAGTLQTRRSTLQRNAAANALLHAGGTQIAVIELRGALFFGSSFDFSQDAAERIPARGAMIVNLEEVTDIDSSGAAALCDLARACREAQSSLWLAGRLAVDSHHSVLGASGLFDVITPNEVIDTIDNALERAELMLLHNADDTTRHVGVPLARAGLFQGFSKDDMAIVRSFFEERHLSSGETLFKKGDPVDGLYVIDEGQIGVRIEDVHGVSRRIAAFTPGTMIGEIAFIEGGSRSALVVAEEESRLWLLKRDRLGDIEKVDPKIVHKLIVNITREIAARLRLTTDDLRRR